MNAREIVQALGGRNGLARCPAHNDRTPSLSVRDGADGVLLTCFSGCDRRDVIAALRDLGLWPERDERPVQQRRRATAPAPKPAQPRTALADWARELWARCLRIERTDAAGAYLASRACALPHPDGDLRWHPTLKHPSGHVGPALVGLITAAVDADRQMSLHRTWIDPARPGSKADIDRPRLMLAGHPVAGGVVRLCPDEAVTYGLAVAEGIETSLVAARGFTSVWACLSAGGIAALPYLYPLDALTVIVDHDPAGMQAFEAVARRWHEDSSRYRAPGDLVRHAEIRKVMAPRPGDDLAAWAEGIDHAGN